MATNRTKQLDSSVQSTSSVLAALDSDNSDVEVLSSESDNEYDDISETDRKQGNKLEMDKSCDSTPVPSL